MRSGVASIECCRFRRASRLHQEEEAMTQLAPLQAQQQVLLHELNHRINNEFAAVISVVSLTAARADNDDVKAALSGVTALLHHHAAVHRALQMPEHDSLIDAAAYLRKLCVAISRSQLEPRKINLVLAPQPLRLEAERCWRIGLIVYELVINAAWHAFPRGDGEVRLELLRTGPFVECRVSDNGSSPPKIRLGHGLKIVDELARSLDGRFEQRLGPHGSRSIVIFPLEDAEAQARQTRIHAL
jgi:two-component sensor histidine kinase